MRDKHKTACPWKPRQFCLQQAGIAPGEATWWPSLRPIAITRPHRWHYARRYWYAPDRALDALLNGNRRYRRYRNRRIIELLEQLGIDPATSSSSQWSTTRSTPPAPTTAAASGENCHRWASTRRGRVPPPLLRLRRASHHRIHESSTPTRWAIVWRPNPSSWVSDMPDGEYKVMGMAPWRRPGRYDFPASPASSTANTHQYALRQCHRGGTSTRARGYYQ